MRQLADLYRGLLLLLVAVVPLLRASEPLEQVPRDALGVAVVRNLAEADVKVGKLLGAVGAPLPGPLAILKSIAGLEAGLDLQRDLLLVLLPPENNSRQFHLAVWLPVSDYDALVRSLEGDPERRVSAVTIAGEDLLVVRHDDWAVVMDPDQRERLEQLRGGEAAPSQQLAEWADLVDATDAAVVVLPAGMRAIWAWAVAEQLFGPGVADAAADKPRDGIAPARNARLAGTNWPQVRATIRSLLADAPELTRWAAETESIACGLRLDDSGNAIVGLQFELSEAALQPAAAEARSTKAVAAPRLYEGGSFVVAGSGQVSPRWAVPAVAPYVRQVVNELSTIFGVKLDEADVAEFRRTAEQAVAEVNAFAVLTRPGEGAEGVFTNNFLAVRVGSSKTFLSRAANAMQQWNTMVDKSQGPIRLVFESKPISVAERQGTEFSIDMAKAIGEPALPDVRQSMEKLFGPGGDFRLQFVAVDDRTVLLAAGTAAQASKAVAVIDGAEQERTDQPELRAAAALFTKQSDWRLFASPHGYNQWLKRQMDAVLGQVIGGPVVTEFPASPPVGLAGGVDGSVVWTEFAVPAATIRSIGEYLRK